MSSLSPSTHALDARLAQRQRLPNETLTTILGFLEPWDSWRLRLVSQNFNAYIMRYLAPRVFLPSTTIFVRGEDSWIFVGANDDERSESEATENLDGSSTSDSVDLRGSAYDHRGRKLVFLSTRPPPLPAVIPGSGSLSADSSRLPLIARPSPSLAAQPLADFLPSAPSIHAILRSTISSPVQIIIRINSRYYRHTPPLSSLCIDRTSLILSVDWCELFNALLHMPEEVRMERERKAWPSRVWIPRRAAWVTRGEEDDDSDAMSIAETESEVGEEREDLHVHISVPASAASAELGSVSQGGESELETPVAVEPELDTAPPLVLSPPLVAVPHFEEEEEEEDDDDGALTELTEVLLPNSPFHPSQSPHSPDAVRGFSHDGFLSISHPTAAPEEVVPQGSAVDEEPSYSYSYELELEEKDPSSAPGPTDHDAGYGGFSLLGEYEDSPPWAPEPAGVDEKRSFVLESRSPSLYDDARDLPPFDVRSVAGTEPDVDVERASVDVESSILEKALSEDDDDESLEVYFSPPETPEPPTHIPLAEGGAGIVHIPPPPSSPSSSASQNPKKQKKTYRSIGIQVSLLALSPLQFLFSTARASIARPSTERARLGRYASWP